MTSSQETELAPHLSQPKDLFSVAGKVVVVTGSNRGIGRTVAEGFLARGASVAFVARSPKIQHQLSQYDSSNALAVMCDLADRAAIARVAPQVVDRFGRIDVLVNCAGISPVNQYADDVWSTVLNVNLSAVFYLSKAVAEQMKVRGGGAIINFTSVAAEQAFPDNAAYCASKGGVKQMTRALARDWGPYHIRVNNIGPGYITTDMTARSYANEKLRSQRIDRMMLDRWGSPEDIVGPSIFLASDAARYVTGTDLYVDGGWLSKAQ